MVKLNNFYYYIVNLLPVKDIYGNCKLAGGGQNYEKISVASHGE